MRGLEFQKTLEKSVQKMLPRVEHIFNARGFYEYKTFIYRKIFTFTPATIYLSNLATPYTDQSCPSTEDPRLRKLHNRCTQNLYKEYLLHLYSEAI